MLMPLMLSMLTCTRVDGAPEGDGFSGARLPHVPANLLIKTPNSASNAPVIGTIIGIIHVVTGHLSVWVAPGTTEAGGVPFTFATLGEEGTTREGTVLSENRGGATTVVGGWLPMA